MPKGQKWPSQCQTSNFYSRAQTPFGRTHPPPPISKGHCRKWHHGAESLMTLISTMGPKGLTASFLPGTWHHLFSAWVESISTDSSQCSCVRTIASKTQGALTGHLEDKWELQLPLVSHQRRFLLLGYQWLFLEVTAVLLGPCLLVATLVEEDGILGSYIDARHLKQVVGICIVYFVAINRDGSRTFGHGLYSTHYLVHVLY